MSGGSTRLTCRPSSMSSRPAVAAIERLARRSALPLAQRHLHRLYAARTLLAGQFAESADYSGRALAIARDSGDVIAMSMHYAHGIRMAVVRGATAWLPDGCRDLRRQGDGHRVAPRGPAAQPGDR